MVAALLLKRAGYNHITILEKRADPGFFDPLREFTYRVSVQGMEIMDHAGVQEAVQEAGVLTSETLVCLLDPKTVKAKIVKFPF